MTSRKDNDTYLRDLIRAERRRHLLEPATIHGRALKSERARQHLTEGFNRRLLMLEFSVDRIQEITDTDGKPLSAFAVPELAIHVNSFWLNICGALDNLAWAITYELNILPGVAEGPGQGRERVGLANPKFLAELESFDKAFALDLKPFSTWQKELRDLRDPAAHRIPIYPIPGMLHGEKAAEAEQLYRQADDLMRANRLSDGLAAIDEANALAVYKPWISLSHSAGLEVRDLYLQTTADEEQFTSVSEVVLNRLFRDEPGYELIVRRLKSEFSVPAI